MEKLIRGSASRPHLLTHFHPSHHPPLQLPLSVIHSPSTANELILSHTLCLQLYLFLRTVQHGFFFFPLHQKARDGCWLPPCLQLDALLFILLSFLPLLSCPLVSPVCRCWRQVVKQAALSKWRRALRSLQFCY